MSAPPLTVQLFGTPRVLINDQPIAAFHSSKVAGLLYYLAADPRPRGRETLAGLLWPDYDATQGKKNLRGALYHLRKTLDPYLHVERQEIGLLAGAPVQVDLIDFEAALARARSEAEGSPAQLAALEDALYVYRGAFLEGFTLDDSDLFEEWVDIERRRLHELAVQALNRLVSAQIQTGDLLRGIDYATQLISLDPLREETRRNLIFMLAADGQAHAALAHFDDYCRLLEAELGVPPGTELTELVARIRAGEFDDAAPMRLALPTRRRHNLPAELTPIIGRDPEMIWIMEALRDPAARLITIAGVGGTGETRLALHVGRLVVADLAADGEAPGADHPLADGVFLVDLAGLDGGARSEEQIAAAIADALQLKLDSVDPDAVAAALSERRQLLILDNFELLQGVGRYLTTLLERAPGLRLLVTSRVRLKLRGEQVLVLDGLPAPPEDETALQRFPATALFMRAATTASATDELRLDQSDAEAVAATCRLLHGLPLGIELAAAWMPMLSPREILTEIRQGLDFLQSDMPDLPERHRSLRAVFERSWLQLSDGERAGLARLALFRGGFSRHAAEEVANASLLTLRQLHDKLLIRFAAPEDDESSQGGRYEIAEILRRYAAERLDDPAAYRDTRTRHARFFLDFLAERQPELRSGDQPGALDAIGSEIDNIRFALSWLCEVGGGLAEISVARFRQGAFALFDFLDTRGWYAEGAALLAQLADAVEPADPEWEALVAELRARQAWFVWHLGRAEESQAILEACLTTLRKMDAPSATVFTLNYLGAVLQHQGRLDAALAVLTEASAIANAEADRFGASVALNNLGQVALQQGDYDQALAQCEAALALKRAINDQRGMTYALTTLVRVAMHDGRHAEARRLFGESLQISEGLGDVRGMGLALRNLGDVAADLDEQGTAQRMYRASVEALRETGSRGEISVSLARQAAAACAQNQPDAAPAPLHEALAIALEIESEPALVGALLTAANLLRQLDEPERSGQIVRTLQAAASLSRSQQERLQLPAAAGEGASGTPPDLPDAPTDLTTVAQRTLGLLESRSRH